MQLIVRGAAAAHVALDTIDEFEKAVLSDATVTPVEPVDPRTNQLCFLWYRVVKKSGLPIYSHAGWPAVSFLNHHNRHLFTVMMGLDVWKCLARFLMPFQKRSIYLFDAWPATHDQIGKFVDFFNVEFVFVSSSMAAGLLGRKLKRSNIHWIPEGVNPDEYRSYAYEDKTIDVLALGRRYDRYHDLVVDHLEAHGKAYLYEKVKGEIIFPTREGFVEGLGRSKISICVPSSITHPERSGDIQTMTIRYLQSMVSKCLVLGHAPAEMIELFGYNPVVEIDMADPQGQLLSIIDHYTDYIPLIERNYQMVTEHHTWRCRWNQIKAIMGT